MVFLNTARQAQRHRKIFSEGKSGGVLMREGVEQEQKKGVQEGLKKGYSAKICSGHLHFF
jgi:hypothetical protein